MSQPVIPRLKCKTCGKVIRYGPRQKKKRFCNWECYAVWMAPRWKLTEQQARDMAADAYEQHRRATLIDYVVDKSQESVK